MFLKGWYSCRVSLFLILTVLFMTAIINLIIFVSDDCEHSDQYRISPRWSHELILCTILWFLESMIRQPAGFCRKRVCLPGDGRSLLTFSDSPLNEMCSSKPHGETPLTAITEPVRSCFLCAARAVWTVATTTLENFCSTFFLDCR